MELLYDCELHVGRAKGLTLVNGDATMLLIPAMKINNCLPSCFHILSNINTHSQY